MITTSLPSSYYNNYPHISPFSMNQNLQQSQQNQNQNLQVNPQGQQFNLQEQQQHPQNQHSISSLSKYSLNQNSPNQSSTNSEINASPYSSPSSNSTTTNTQNYTLPHSSVTLPSIHSLDIPSFPHTEESLQQQQQQNLTNSHSNNNSNRSSIHSPPLLIPKSSSFSDEPVLDLNHSNHHTHHPQPFNYTHTINLTNNVNNNPNNQVFRYSNSPPILMKSPTQSQQSSNFTVGSYKSNSSSPSTTIDQQHDIKQLQPQQEPQQLQDQTQQQQTETLSPEETQSTTEDSSQIKKNWKPRKKRQCPECKLYFSNLATHKSTHLKPTNRPHICEFCQRGFARPNDLFRHVKCHWKEIGSDKGQFKCPFKSMTPSGTSNVNENNKQTTEDGKIISIPDHCCHNTGIFSRCDTFKNHLKAIHFQYPNGTKKDQRNKVNGKCRMCLKNFNHVDDWIHNHIETNDCPHALNIIKKV
ncbi:STP4 [Candida pseudojiufengensis]|uniref:STP4 n=1 Tax=Candida pseudojiufengensis TaxID=497109 RepID=UPI00222557D6|nr:STP4 [Candida pseudojiufengensis]KAI5958945.1 STP4 [Candida pseudojiufengensis]